MDLQVNHINDSTREDLDTLLAYLRGSKDAPLGYVLGAYHRLLAEATHRYHEQPNKPLNKEWLNKAVIYNWPLEKYASRLESLFKEHDSLSTSFPWFLVLQIFFQLFRLLLRRA